jgi:hypothetical protein
MLTEYRQGLDDLSARLGATAFGRADPVDMSRFSSLKYALM